MRSLNPLCQEFHHNTRTLVYMRSHMPYITVSFKSHIILAIALWNGMHMPLVVINKHLVQAPIITTP